MNADMAHTGCLVVLTTVTFPAMGKTSPLSWVARTLQVPAVNNAGMWGRWGSVEIGEPWDAKAILRDGRLLHI